MKTLKRALPYLLTSILIIGLWKLWTWTDNYAFNPKGKDLLMLDIALISIFYYKTVFWLIMANSTVFFIRQLRRKNFKTSIITATGIILFYLVVGQTVNKKCAFFYYSVFHNQTVPEELIDRPIVKAGYQIGPIVTENIIDKEMKYRLYALGGLKIIKYKPATQTLSKILLDKSEVEVFRAEAFEVLTAFDTDESRKIITNFRNQATDSLDKKVIELGDFLSSTNR
jgi:hypothetical protein